MLSELYIRDFAIIDELRLRFAPGFNVMTGETGAGKSIILDAVALVLGGRADTTVIRSGCSQAYVEATFTLSPGLQASLSPLLAQEGLEDDGDTLLLAREVRENGRHIGRVNGRAVSLSVLKELGDYLVDVHGQGEHLSLLKPRAHLPLLDSYAGLDGERAAVGREVSQLRAIQRELADLRRNERTLAQRVDLLQFQINEIDAANLRVGEEEELRAERTRLANVEHLIVHTNEALSLLSGLDDDARSAIDLLGQAERAAGQLARLDQSQTALLERLEGLTFQLNEVTADLRHYQEQLEFNPQRLEYVEERLELLARLKRKYGADVGEILATRDQAAAELETITHSEERIQELVAAEDSYLHRIGLMAQALSLKRQAAAWQLAAAVERELTELNMAGARFEVRFSHQPDENGVFVPAEGEAEPVRYAFDQTGVDEAEFLISANPGEPLKPMARVASGGETARLMLALKTALAQVDATPTLIFDEIDQGIGGRVGGVVGQKLWGLATDGRHQTIVVTHLPQLAGFGDCHFHVSKQVSDGRTTTLVETLDRRGRLQELAAMLGTQGDSALDGAESILAHAARVKGRET
ncbi:MAG: DNA repair protein RecN [Chloroflexota bacterium]